MQLTKPQKILAAVLAVGIAALFMDRVVLTGSATGPSDASAEGITTSAADLSPMSAQDSVGQVLPQPTMTPGANVVEIGSRLERLAAAEGIDPASVRDAFTPADTWIPVAVRTRPAAPQYTPQAQRFLQAHRLMAVMGVGQNAIALIDGRALRVGRQIDGFTLIEINPRAVILASAHEQVQLKLNPSD